MDKGYEKENEEGVYMYQDDKDGNDDGGCGDDSCVDKDYDDENVEDVNMYKDDKEGDDDKEDVGSDNKVEKDNKVDKEGHDDTEDMGKENKDEKDTMKERRMILVRRIWDIENTR